jgi:hypothetical protein
MAAPCSAPTPLSLSPIKEFILAVKMLSISVGVGHAATFHYPIRRYGYVAAQRGRAAAAEAADRRVIGREFG